MRRPARPNARKPFVPSFEVIVTGRMRDYRVDPESPIHTLNLGPERVAYSRWQWPTVAEGRAAVRQHVAEFQREWDACLGTRRGLPTAFGNRYLTAIL